MHKENDNFRKSFIYIENYVLDQLTDFTICFWLKPSFGTILTFDDDFSDSNYYNHNGFTIDYDRFRYYEGENIVYYRFDPDCSIWSFYEYTFKKSGSYYLVSFFYQGEKKVNEYWINVKYFKKSYIILGAWSHLNYNDTYGFYGYMYDFSIYDEILHTENYNRFPKREMNYNPNTYVGMQKENNLYGMI